MGGAPSSKSLNLAFPFFFLFFFLTILILIGPSTAAELHDHDDSKETPLSMHKLDHGGATGIDTANSTHGNSSDTGKSPTFKPSTTIIVSVLATMFVLTFLILLYIKHCNGGNAQTRDPISQGAQIARKNSGIDRAVVESLPIFRFGSLRGQKEGLDCAVCLTRFENPEVLRLLPKCQHAFHVECVDKWLESHSTCPLCRYRVDPEEIILIEDPRALRRNQSIPPPQRDNEGETLDIESGGRESVTHPELQNPKRGSRRVSGRRHSSLGEKDGGFLQTVLQKGNEKRPDQQNATTTSFRRSLDSASCAGDPSTSTSRKHNEIVSVGMSSKQEDDRDLEGVDPAQEQRCWLEHRIIVDPTAYGGGASGGAHQQRWSDIVQPSDHDHLLYLTSDEMIINNRPCSSSSRQRSCIDNEMDKGGSGGGGVINWRSVSEVTGLRRFMSNRDHRNRNRAGMGGGKEGQQHEERLVSRWLGWINSKSQRQGNVR